MRKIVVDTNAYSFLCKGRSDVAQLLSNYDLVLVPAIVLGELEAGFHGGTRYAQNKDCLNRFLSLPRVRILGVTKAAAEAYGQIYSALKNAGTLVPINDVWIAAQTIAEDAALVTFDEHFKKIPGLNLILKEV